MRCCCAIELDPEGSARQRDEFLRELGAITSFDAAAEWAKRIIPSKNRLTASDAGEVADTLEAKLAEVGGVDEPMPSPIATKDRPPSNGRDRRQVRRAAPVRIGRLRCKPQDLILRLMR